MKILEVKFIYDENRISRIAVLADYSSFGSDIRAIIATNKPGVGYVTISDDSKLNSELIKNVANYGMEVNASEEFPGWKKRYK